MSNVNCYMVNGRIRYKVELSPGSTVEANTLAEILNFLFTYGVTSGKP